MIDSFAPEHKKLPSLVLSRTGLLRMAQRDEPPPVLIPFSAACSMTLSSRTMSVVPPELIIEFPIDATLGPRKVQCAIRAYESGIMPLIPAGHVRTVTSRPAHSRLIFLPVPAQFSGAVRAHVPVRTEILQPATQLAIAVSTRQFYTSI